MKTATDAPSSPPAPSSVVESTTKTEIKILKCSHTWTIKNFSYCWMKPGECLKSDKFFDDADTGIKWRLSLYPSGLNADNKDYVSVFLSLASSYRVEVRAKYKFYIVNDRGAKANSWELAGARTFLQTSSAETEGFGNLKYVSRQFLNDNANRLLPEDSLTLLCDVSASTIVPCPVAPIGNVVLADTWGCTRVNLEKVSHMWTISNFSFCNEAPGVALRSPIFPSGEQASGGKPTWQLQLYPNGHTEKLKESLAVYLHPAKANQRDVPAKLKLWIINAKREKTNLMWFGQPYTFPKGNTGGRGYEDFVKRSDLFAKSSALLADDRLVILCEVEYVAKVESVAGDGKPASLRMPECRLADDFGALMETPTLSDVTLVVGGKEMRAHRAILGARSAVFRDMIGASADKSEGRVEIRNVEYRVFRELLRFVYTGRVNDLGEIASALLKAADTYRLERLKVMCEEALCSMLGIENAAGLLVLAAEHNAGQLRARVVDFVNAHADEVIADERFKWLFVTHPALIAEVALGHLLKPL